MICLDTNYLIRALLPETRESGRVEEWIAGSEPIILPVVAWYEFLCGCTPEEEQVALAVLTGGLRPFDDREARISARIFRLLKTPRRLQIDAMIAGTAIAAGASLATNNRADFKPFVTHGLQLL